MLRIHAILIAASVALVSPPARAQVLVWVAGRDLQLNEASVATETVNPNAVVPEWSYGRRSVVASPLLTLFTPADHGNNFGGTGLDGYSLGLSGTGPDVMVNVTNTTTVTNYGFGPNPGIAPLEMRLHPASNNDYAVVRWTAPAAGSYTVTAYWRDDDPHGGNGATGDVVLNGVPLFNSSWANGATASLPSPLTLTLAAGDKLDFLLGSAGDWSFDSTAFDATITAVPEPNVAALLALGATAVLAGRKRRPVGRGRTQRY